jgi:hypothetical protein
LETDVVKQGFIAHLLANSGVTALVGGRVAESVDAAWGPHLPYVLVREIFWNPVRHLRGAAGLEKSLLLPRCFGGSVAPANAWASADAVAAAVYAAITANGFSGAWSGNTVVIARWDDRNDSDAVQGGEERNLAQINLTLSVWHKPA